VASGSHVNKKKTVIVTEYVDPAGLERLDAESRLIYLPDSPCTPLESVIGEAHGLGVRLARITPVVMDAAPSLKIIAKHGVGVDNIDVAAATARRIPVTTTPRANSISVAEHILSMMLNLANRVCAADADLKAGRFTSRENYVGVELHEKTFGVVGLGRIGTEVARMAHDGLAMRICFYDPMVSAGRGGIDYYSRASTLPELLQQADFVALCLPLTADTTGLIGAEELSMMKPTAFLVNTARGGLVDEQALYEALSSGNLAGAAADAFVHEPVPSSHPLLSLDNFIATPHVGGATREAMKRMSIDMADEILRVLRGDRPQFAVNPEVLG
jgi:D-3-phosphoglycerate dehydrogenase